MLLLFFPAIIIFSLLLNYDYHLQSYLCAQECRLPAWKATDTKGSLSLSSPYVTSADLPWPLPFPQSVERPTPAPTGSWAAATPASGRTRGRRPSSRSRSWARGSPAEARCSTSAGSSPPRTASTREWRACFFLACASEAAVSKDLLKSVVCLLFSTLFLD